MKGVAKSKQAVAAPARAPAAAPAARGAAAVTPVQVGPTNLELATASGQARAMIQPGPPNAPEEQAAHRLAHKTLTGPARAPCACGGICPACRGKPGAAGSRALSRNPAPAQGDDRLFGGSGRPLDLASRNWFEPRLGVGLDHVRVHDDRETAANARGMRARAFTLGNRIGFGDGEHRPSTAAGRAVLAHELSHVVLKHQGVRRVGFDDGLSDAELDLQIERGRELRAEQEAARARHEAWKDGILKRAGADLGDQAGDMDVERERIGMQLSGAQAQGFDEAAEGGGWLAEELKKAGYAGPGIAEVKQLWAKALVAADAIKLSAEGTKLEADKPAVGAETKLATMGEIEAYYAGASQFAKAAEDAHQRHSSEENAKAEARYREDLARSESAHEMTMKDMRGDPMGGRAAAASMALMKNKMMPSPPDKIVPPTAISQNFPAYIERIRGAASDAQWKAVSADVRASAAAIGKFVTASLPTKSAASVTALSLEKLLSNMDKLERENKMFKRIPAVFYPRDALTTHSDGQGNSITIPQAIPWHFYLVHESAQVERDGMCALVSKWVLIDLTNPPARNEYPSSMADAMSLEQNKWVDPPVELFTPLNSKLRFPEGELYFTMPSGTAYVHHMTEPWSFSDWISAIGMVFAGIALVAGVIATGGAAAPGAIAFGASLGAAAFGSAGTLLALQEKGEHGLLTEEDKTRAGIDIGLNVLSAATLGLGRVVSAPGAAVRFGARFGAMASSLRALRVANLAGDLFQVGLVTSDLVTALQAIKNNPNIPEGERDKMIGQLARRALLTGAMMTIAVKGDISELRAGGNLHLTGMDNGVPVAKPSGDADPSAPKPPIDVGVPGAPHVKVEAEVHATGEAKGTGLTLAGNPHALGVSGSGPTRDIYFCSDYCTSAVNKIGAVLEALPPNHPMVPAFQDMLQKAMAARKKLKAGTIDEAQANQIAADLRDRMARLTKDDKHGHTLGTLLDMNPDVIAGSAADIQKGIAKGLDIGEVRASAEAEFAPPLSLADFRLRFGGKPPRRPPSWKEADESVMDAETRMLLPDFDRRVSKTGLISSIKARIDAEGALGVTIKGEVDPGKLSRNPDKIAAGAEKAPSFNAMLGSRLGRLKDAGLKGWQRLHLWGPGFGDEAAAGMMLGPTSMNQLWQNGDLVITAGKKTHYGIEGYIREMAEAAKASGGKLKLTTAATAWGDPTPGGFKAPLGEPVLRSAQYKIELVNAEGKIVTQTTVHMELPDPATWKSPLTVKPVVTVSGDGATTP